MTLPLYIPGLSAAPRQGEPAVALSLEGLNDEPRVPYTGKMKYLHSVSELKMLPPSHKGCPRKWALMYLQRVPKVPNEALIDGTLLHSCIHQAIEAERSQTADQQDVWNAKWMTGERSRTGREMRWYGRLAQAMLRHVPDAERQKGVCEATAFLEIPELDTAIYIKPDWLVTKKFRDWKSTAAVTKKSEWVLQDPTWHPSGIGPEHYSITNDIQSRTYAHGLMKLCDWDVIDASWVYGSKKFTTVSNIKTWTCDAKFERDETAAWVKTNVYPLIRWMNAVKDAFGDGRLDSALLVPHSSKACEGRGKFCDAFSHCRMHQSPIPLSAVNLPIIPH